MKVGASIYFLSLVACFTISSCTVNKRVEILRPARITIPKELKTVIMVDRTSTQKGQGNKTEGVIEGILTGESPFADRMGAQHCFDGFEQLTVKNERLDLAHRDVIVMKGEGAHTRSKQLDWETVDSLCDKYNADAIVELNHFDSDQFGGLAAAAMNYRDIDLNIKTGWRLYYPSTKEVLDDYRMETFWDANRSIYFYDPLPPANRAVAEAGYLSGYNYGRHLVPSFYLESRKIYKTGSPEMKTAARMALADNWDGAEKIWSQLVSGGTTNRKVLKRATYNLAVAQEMRGNLEKAVELARKSYEVFGNNDALQYYRFLQGRKQDQQLLEEQLKD